jgi:hypothetical protein
VAEIITVNDLPLAIRTHELAAVMVAGANGKASRVAPCLADSPTADQLAEAKLVLIGAVKRWADAGSGALSAQTAGPFGQTLDTRQRMGYNLWPSEITDLQGVCGASQGLTSIELVSSQGSRYCVDDFDAGWPDSESS